MKKTVIFLLIVFAMLSKDCFGFDIFDRGSSNENKFYKKEKAYSDAEEAFLRGDYKSVVTICENITSFFKDRRKLDDVYYLKGQAYLKLNENNKARSAFNEVINIDPKGNYAGRAELAVADSFFSEGDFEKAGALYKALIGDPKKIRLHSTCLYRLVQIEKKSGNSKEASEYLDKLVKEFPLSFEAQSVTAGNDVPEGGSFVQVGSFEERKNAEKLLEELRSSGYDASMDKTEKNDKVMYKIIVKPSDAEGSLDKIVHSLKKEGYPTKICP